MGMADNDMALQEINHFSPISLLIQSLVEQLCKFLEDTPGQQKRLYSGNGYSFHKDKSEVFASVFSIGSQLYELLTFTVAYLSVMPFVAS
jgi:hypothetical protein